eukprot:18094-Chlamydomonas_euryale.AAC.1
MAQTVAIWSLTLYVSLASSIFDSIGSSGNSAMRRPSLVSSPCVAAGGRGRVGTGAGGRAGVAVGQAKGAWWQGRPG